MVLCQSCTVWAKFLLGFAMGARQKMTPSAFMPRRPVHMPQRKLRGMHRASQSATARVERAHGYRSARPLERGRRTEPVRWRTTLCRRPRAPCARRFDHQLQLDIACRRAVTNSTPLPGLAKSFGSALRQLWPNLAGVPSLTRLRPGSPWITPELTISSPPICKVGLPGPALCQSVSAHAHRRGRLFDGVAECLQRGEIGARFRPPHRRLLTTLPATPRRPACRSSSLPRRASVVYDSRARSPGSSISAAIWKLSCRRNSFSR